MAQPRSSYLPAMKAMPGLTNQQIYQLQHLDTLRAAGHDPAAYFQQRQHEQQQYHHHQAHQVAAHIPDSDCVTAVEGREVNGRQVGNGTFDPAIARSAAYSSHFPSFYNQ